jgi:hypothetical protein
MKVDMPSAAPFLATRRLFAIFLLALSALFAFRAQTSWSQEAAVPQAAADQKPSADGKQPAGAKPAPDGKQAEEGPAETPARLLDRPPFDRITLNAANGNLAIDTVLLDLPDRKVPDPLPKSGTLSIRRLSHPSIPYAVEWSAVEKVELYEQLLLAEANRLTAAGNFAEAFDYLAFLSTNYPKLEGLEQAMENHLWREASATYAGGKRDEAWPILQALYLRNPRFPRLVNAVQAVSDDLIKERLKADNFAAARSIVDELERAFRELPLTSVAKWRQQFQQDAEAEMTKARAALAEQNYSEARHAVALARAILPSIAGGEELWKQIQSAAPEIRVGVAQAGAAAPFARTPDWAAARVSGLTDPRLVQMVNFGAEGGVYASSLAELRTSQDGLTTTIRLSPAALQQGLLPGALALRLVDMASDDPSRREDDFAAVFDHVSINDGRDVLIKWRRPYIRPEALLQVPLRWLTSAERSPGLWFEAAGNQKQAHERRYQRAGTAAAANGEPRFIVEEQFKDDEAAINALMRGDVDVLDRVPPWQLARLKASDGIVLAPYRLPSVHVLVPNFKNPLIEVREFRRALCYGIDAQNIVRDILLGGQETPGFRTLTGPFPAGSTLTDPAGYAYNADIPARPYEPRLAALLSIAARTTLVKQEVERKKAEETAKRKKLAEEKGAKLEEAKTPAKPAAEAKSAEGPIDPAKLPKPEPLVLAHSTDPLARLACQSIKLQLDQVGIPVKLAEFAGEEPPEKLKYDLLYAELALFEPMSDARGTLGPNGVAGRCSPLMSLALDELPLTENWKQARVQLNEIHRIAHYDLPVIPLWQTVNYCAYRKNVTGVGDQPVSLYQRVSAWRKAAE